MPPVPATPSLVWFRDDLRVDDNPALAAAMEDGGPVLALFVLDEVSPGMRPLGGAARWWLHHSLLSLQRDLAGLGIPLLLHRGAAIEVLPRVQREAGAAAVLWNRRYEAAAIEVDRSVKERLRSDRVRAESFNGALLVEPWDVANKAGEPFRVFSPFFRAVLARGEPPAPRPLAPCNGARASAPEMRSDDLADWRLLPSAPDWAGGLRDTWQPGEAGAKARLAAFLESGLADYAARRDEPGEPVTSRLSPHLRFGEISPRRVWHAARLHAETHPDTVGEKTLAKFHAELGWREFSYHLLYHFPTLRSANFQPRFDQFPWSGDEAAFAAWTRGLTGYPLVDAGMRELWHTGTMHNRVRMVVASFLVKHLMIDWRRGEAWFWDTLVDADAANNPASWQWVAGSGADAAPYFRIFNPASQGEKFDGAGLYTRRWVPELARLPDAWLFKPEEAPRDVLARAGVRLGDTYPRPLVDHAWARQRALAAFESLKTGA